MKSQDEDWDDKTPSYHNWNQDQSSEGFENTGGKSGQVWREAWEVEQLAIPNGMLFGKMSKSRRLPCYLRHTAPSRLPLMVQHNSSAVDILNGSRLAPIDNTASTGTDLLNKYH